MSRGALVEGIGGGLHVRIDLLGIRMVVVPKVGTLPIIEGEAGQKAIGEMAEDIFQPPVVRDGSMTDVVSEEAHLRRHDPGHGDRRKAQERSGRPEELDVTREVEAEHHGDPRRIVEGGRLEHPRRVQGSVQIPNVRPVAGAPVHMAPNVHERRVLRASHLPSTFPRVMADLPAFILRCRQGPSRASTAYALPGGSLADPGEGLTARGRRLSADVGPP